MPKINQMHTTVVLAMSADGKIANSHRSPARFGSALDQAHLETQIAHADGVLFGAGTLRAYGTTKIVKQPDLLDRRAALGKPPQPVQIVASGRGDLNPNFRFFSQPVPRWLITATDPDIALPFEKIILAPQIDSQINSQIDFQINSQINSPINSPVDSQATMGAIDWLQAFEKLATLGIKKLVVSGGGALVAALIALDLVDELWLTVCPVIFGGRDAPTPVAGLGLPAQRQLQLLTAEVVEAEVFLHYRFLPQISLEDIRQISGLSS
ncbi:MAG: RibD family protein [Coleofasciculaceae cyanobacterium SM2_1_6]|nr:RibD family protein [Coleofasciculaceae cyanobacterium SM2_1_6]